MDIFNFVNKYHGADIGKMLLKHYSVINKIMFDKNVVKSVS